VDIEGVVEAGEGAADDQPVLQRIAGARGRLGAVAQHPPPPVGTAPEVGGVDVRPAAAGRGDAAHGADEVQAAGDGGGGQQALGHQTALAVDVGQHRLQHRGALGDAGGDLVPLGLGQDERQGIERPVALGLLAIDAVGGAGIADVAAGETEAVARVAGREGGEVAQEIQPMVARPTARIEQLVRDAGQRLVVLDPVAQTPRGVAFGLDAGGGGRHVRSSPRTRCAARDGSTGLEGA
jgi:hypothetical protein